MTPKLTLAEGWSYTSPMTTSQLTPEEQAARRAYYVKAAKEAAFWAIIVFVAVFVWRGMPRP